jgi:hypothetical protein
MGQALKAPSMLAEVNGVGVGFAPVKENTADA